MPINYKRINANQFNKFEHQPTVMMSKQIEHPIQINIKVNLNYYLILTVLEYILRRYKCRAPER